MTESEIKSLRKNRDEWRKLALKFDAQRMQALWYLQAVLAGDAFTEKAKAFLVETPKADGFEVATVYHAGSNKHYTARLLYEMTPQQLQDELDGPERG